jgi:hypothetical protein
MVSTIGAFALIIGSALILLRTLVVPRRSGVLTLVAIVGLTTGLTLRSPSRHVGDSREHVAMASSLAHGAAPRPADGGSLRRSWFYALTAAPLVRGAEIVGREPRFGFAVLNIGLLAGAGALLARLISPVAAVLLAAGPIVWWVDKAHPDVFIFSLLCLAFALLPVKPWWAIVALGLAAAQEPSLVVALLAALAFAALPTGFADRRLWLAAGVAVALAALYPAYQYAREGNALLSLFAANPHLPFARELLSIPFDPNLGIFVHGPFVTAAVAIALILALVKAPSQVFSVSHAAVFLIGALLVVMFTQMLNINSGGTPGPSRWGLWLLPLAIPVLQAAPPSASVRLVTALSLVWCTIFFAPSVDESYLQPSKLASVLWQRWPASDNPLVEVFSERVSGSQPAPAPPLATAGCEKVLIVGRGSGSPTAWPGRCEAQMAPPFCREVGVLCYANRTAGGYAFAQLPEEWTATAEHAVPHHRVVDPLAVAMPETQTVFSVVGVGPGWSYLEELTERDIRWRWMGDQAELAIRTQDAVGARLRVDTRSHDRPRRLRISIPAGEIATWIVTPTRATFETGTFQLPAGPTIVRFESLDGSDPAPGEDPRRLSIAVFGIRVFEAP